MTQALALLVGLRKVDATKYLGWTGENGCQGCELDVDNIERILAPSNYDVTILKTEKATRRNVIKELRAAADKLESGDILVFYYSGHGGQQPDQNGDELDGQDETLVLYDGELRDDALNKVWLSIKPGVRVVMLSDSCNSGTNYKGFKGFKPKATPIAPLDAKAAGEMRAMMIHMGGCRDGKTSDGYVGGGLFTMSLCNAWQGGKFKGNSRALYEKVAAMVSAETPDQQPAYNEYGAVSAQFRKQKPFAR